MLNPIKLLFVLFAIKHVISEMISDTCETYNFEESFDESFSYSRMCKTLQAEGEWTLGNYSLTSVELPHLASTSFISPSTIMSCTSSFTFPMSSGGIFEVNVYMDGNDMSDQRLLIFVNELVEEGDDTQVGVILFNPMLPMYQRGWNILTTTLGGTGTYEGYVTFMAEAAEGSKLLVDGFRYIPTWYDTDDCEIYQREIESDESGSGEIDESDFIDSGETDSNETNESDPNLSEENNSNQTDENDIGDSGETVSQSCVTYDFEKYFDEEFSYSRMCTTTQAEGEWTLGNYSLTSVELPHPASTSFISPATTMSCTSSFKFPMSSGGIFEVNVYMDGNDKSDQRLLIFLNELVEEGDDTQVGIIQLNPMLPTYQRGWNMLTATLGGTGTYEGYVSFMAEAAKESIILVDSFRYIPHRYETEECPIYPQKTESEEIDPGETYESESDENITNESNETDSNQTDEDDTSETEDISEPDENESIDIDESHETTKEPTNETDSPEIEEGTNNTNENNSNQTDEDNTDETEDISEPDESDMNETEESNQTTEDNSNETDEDNSSEPPEAQPVRESNFWNPFTITMVVVTSLIALSLVSLCFYECGKRKAHDRLPLVFNDNDIQVPPEMRVPRVNRVYPEASVMFN